MNRLFAGLAMGLLAVTVIAVHLWLAAGKQRESNAALAERIGALEAGRGGTMGQGVALPGEPGGNAATSSASAVAGNDDSAAPDQAAIAAGFAEALQSEGGRDLLMSFATMALQREYPDLEKAMGLTPEEADKLLEILAKQHVDQSNRPVGRSRPPADPAERERHVREMADQAERDRAAEAEIAALLGDRYPKWQEYRRSSSERLRETYTLAARAQLRESISSRDNPMTDATFEAFSAAVEAEERRFQNESPSRSIRHQVQQMPEMHRRMVQAASAHLDAAQVERYRQYLAEQVTMMTGAAATMEGMGLNDDE